MTVRLFQLFNTKENKPVENTYFSSKPAAKTKRQELNVRDPNGQELFQFIVIPGPDHHRYKKNFKWQPSKRNKGSHKETSIS